MWRAILAHLAGVLFQGKCFSFLSLHGFHHLAMKKKMKKVIVINLHLLNFSNFVFHRGMENLYRPPPWSQSIEWWENGERWIHILLRFFHLQYCPPHSHWKFLFQPILRSHRLEGFIDGSKLAPPSTLTNSVANQPPTRSILTGLSVIKPTYCGSMPFLKTWIWPTFALPCYWTQEATAISQERVFHEVGIPSSNQSSLWSTRRLRCPSQRGRSSHPYSGRSSNHLSPHSDVHSNPVSSWSCLVRRAPQLVVCEELNLADDTTAGSFASFSVTWSNPPALIQSWPTLFPASTATRFCFI